MTIEDLIESGIELQGTVRVAVWNGENAVEVFCGEGFCVDQQPSGCKWLESFPITYIYPSEMQDHGFTIEVDGEERS